MLAHGVYALTRERGQGFRVRLQEIRVSLTKTASNAPSQTLTASKMPSQTLISPTCQETERSRMIHDSAGLCSAHRAVAQIDTRVHTERMQWSGENRTTTGPVATALLLPGSTHTTYCKTLQSALGVKTVNARENVSLGMYICTCIYQSYCYSK